MKAKLREMYIENVQRMTNLRIEFPELHGPFLIFPSERYCNAKTKILIIGQQTRGWTTSDDVEKQLECYRDFDFGRKYRSPFLRVFHKLEKAILNEDYIATWDNINRFDFKCKRPPLEIEKRISDLDFLLVREIEILKPDICIWLVGPDFDERLKAIFKGLVFGRIEGWTERQLCRIEHPLLPEKTYRTYHPQFLIRRHLEDRAITTLRKEIGAHSDRGE